MNPRAMYFQALYEAPYLQASPTELSFLKSGGSQNITLTCNINWSVQSKPTWVTLDKSSGTGSQVLSVTCSSNSGLEREGYITISGEDQSVSIYVWQAPSS